MKNPTGAPSKPPKLNSTEISRYRLDPNLIKKVYKFTRHPDFIRVLADEFEDTVLQNKNFIGVHWRFDDKNDFFPVNFLETKFRDLKPAKGLTVNAMRLIQKCISEPEFLVKQVIKHVQNHIRNGISSHDNVIFLSAPRSILSSFKNFTEINGFRVVTSLDTQQFLKKRKSCKIIRDYFGDICSTFDKEIQFKSTMFYRSRPSNWSFNVQAQRWANSDYKSIENDGTVFDVFEDFCNKTCLQSRKIDRNLDQKLKNLK